jgi:hypothetical protein
MLVVSVALVLAYGVVALVCVGVVVFLLGLALELKRPKTVDDE